MNDFSHKMRVSAKDTVFAFFGRKKTMTNFSRRTLEGISLSKYGEGALAVAETMYHFRLKAEKDDWPRDEYMAVLDQILYSVMQSLHEFPEFRKRLNYVSLEDIASGEIANVTRNVSHPRP